MRLPEEQTARVARHQLDRKRKLDNFPEFSSLRGCSDGGKAMPVAQIRGVNINYEVLGKRGPWMALSPGGRRALGEIKYLAEPIAQAGYRVLLHDRRNC